MTKHQPKSIPGYLLNVPTSPDGPYWVMHPTSFVGCALCGAKVRRRKFARHLVESHPEYEAGGTEEHPPLKRELAARTELDSSKRWRDDSWQDAG